MAYSSWLADKPDGQSTYPKHSYHNTSHNPYVKHYYNKCPPQSEATQRPTNSHETHVASPAQPSPATSPQSATESSKHERYALHTNSSQHLNTDTNTKGHRQLHNFLPLSKPYYNSSTPSSRPPCGWRMNVQILPHSHLWTWTTTPSVSNLCLVLSTSPTRKVRPKQPSTSSAPPPPL